MCADSHHCCFLTFCMFVDVHSHCHLHSSIHRSLPRCRRWFERNRSLVGKVSLFLVVLLFWCLCQFLPSSFSDILRCPLPTPPPPQYPTEYHLGWRFKGKSVLGSCIYFIFTPICTNISLPFMFPPCACPPPPFGRLPCLYYHL